MDILVTGGAGFIGSNFLQLLVPRFPEHTFVNVDSLTYAGNAFSLQEIEEAPNYSFAHVDINDRSAVDAIFAKHKPTLVVHFAAESHVDRSIEGPRVFLETNVLGTLNLLEAARGTWGPGEGMFQHVSTDEVYGSLGDEGLFVETTPYDPSSPYSASKAASDHLVRSYNRTYGMPIKITNCSNNYGPRQFPEKLIPLMILNAVERKPLPVYGSGLNVRDWLHVDDHCEAIWAVISKGRVGETYNVGGNSEQKNIDVVKKICAAVAKKTDSAQSEIEALITHVKDRPGHDHRYAIDASKIKRECGWEPTHTFESGLDSTVGWYLENTAWIEQIRSGEYRKWLETNYAGR